MSLQYHFWRRVRAAYYEFGLRNLGVTALNNAVHKWELNRCGDSPKHVYYWDLEFSQGLWDYLGKSDEQSRYWVLIGYMDSLRGGGEFLDVGCGDGVLFQRFKALGYSRYTGVDYSKVAIDKMERFSDDRTAFVQGDGNTYTPSGDFDVIVFCESLYYLHDPVSSLRRYSLNLKDGGHIIISSYTDSRRSNYFLREIKSSFKVMDEVKTAHIQSGKSWLCTVLQK